MKGDSNSSSCAGRSRAPVSPRGIARLVLLARCVRAWKDAVQIVQQAIPARDAQADRARQEADVIMAIPILGGLHQAYYRAA